MYLIWKRCWNSDINFQCRIYFIPNTLLLGPINLIGTMTARTARTTRNISTDGEEDVYGGRTGPLEYNFIYLFIFYLF